MKIHALPAEDRPREKLLAHGVESLTDSELLALVLGSGTCGVSAVELAQSLLLEHGGFSGLWNAPMTQLLHAKGIGRGKASLLVSLAEIYRRGKKEPRMVLAEFLDYLKDGIGLVEEAHLVLLSAKREVLAHRLVAKGTSQGLSLSAAETLRIALSLGAKRIVLVHLHPSGIPFPSPQDIAYTSALRAKVKEVGVVLWDHVILSRDGRYSFRENGVVPEKDGRGPKS